MRTISQISNLKSQIFLIPLICASIALGITGCKGKEAPPPKERLLNVRLAEIKKVRLRPYIEAVGTLKPYEEVVISSEAPGILSAIHVDEGFRVSRGTLLAKIDDADYKIEVERAEAALSQAEASLKGAKAEHLRKEALYKENLVTEQQMENITTALSQAEAQAKIANSNLILARQRLSKTNIVSPLNGTVSERLASAGALIKTGEQLMRVIQVNPLKLDFSVSEKDAGLLRRGQDIIFSVDAFPEREFKAEVAVIYPALEEKTRTLQVEAVAPNAEGILKPGFFAGIRLYTGSERDTVVIPQTALIYEGQHTKVFVTGSDTAKERLVRVGQSFKTGSGEVIEILEGVKEGEQIVTVGQQNLYDGAKINAVKD